MSFAKKVTTRKLSLQSSACLSALFLSGIFRRALRIFTNCAWTQKRASW